MAFLRNSIIFGLFFALHGSSRIVFCQNIQDNLTVQQHEPHVTSTSSGSSQPSPSSSSFSSARAYARDCDNGYSIMCFKMDVVSFLEKMSIKREFSVVPGVSVVRETNSVEPKTEEIVSGN